MKLKLPKYRPSDNVLIIETPRPSLSGIGGRTSWSGWAEEGCAMTGNYGKIGEWYYRTETFTWRHPRTGEEISAQFEWASLVGDTIIRVGDVYRYVNSGDVIPVQEMRRAIAMGLHPPLVWQYGPFPWMLYPEMFPALYPNGHRPKQCARCGGYIGWVNDHDECVIAAEYDND